MFAAAAAARVTAATRQGIEEAVTSNDPEIRSFAENVIEMQNLHLQIRTEQEQRRRQRATKPGPTAS
jgi:hypothetical protein